MSKNFKITEQQYNDLVAEGLDVKANVAATNGDVKAAVANAKNEIKKSGLDPSKTNITINGSDVAESKVVTMKTLRENKLRVLKKNSELMSFRDFVKRNNY